MVVQIAFLILHKISPLENALTEMTLIKYYLLFVLTVLWENVTSLNVRVSKRKISKT